MQDYTKMSPTALRELAARLSAMAAELEAIKPSYQLAIDAGIRDKSYCTVSGDYVNSYSGDVEITMANGAVWRAVGRRARGGASYVSKNGFIEFIPVDVPQLGKIE